MSINGARIGVSCDITKSSCSDAAGCSTGACPDFVIKRYDTRPSFRSSVSDCDGPLDLTEDNLVLEVNMWAEAKLKKAITNVATEIELADGIGFNQVKDGDTLVFSSGRVSERMLVTAFDETNKQITVTRAQDGTSARAWVKGTSIKIMRISDATADIETVTEEVVQPDGSTLEQTADTLMRYDWVENDTCLPGCFLLEFKLLKMDGASIEWVRRFPAAGEFLIQINDTPTAEIA
jgi:hypothetical protein